MSNNLPAVLQDLLTNLVAAEQASPGTGGGDFLYLKMSKGGNWLFGAEDTEVSNDSAFVVDPSSYAQGYVAWADGELLGEFMANAGKPPVLLADLPALPVNVDSEGDPVNWKAQKAFALKGLEGEEEGTQLLYKTSCLGGLKAISLLLSEIIARGKAGNPDLCPIIVLDNDSYKHKIKKYGTIYTPVLTIDEWVGMPTAEDENEEEVHEPKKVEKPKRAAKKKVEPEPEPEQEEEEVPEESKNPAPRKRTRRTRNSG